MFYFCSISQSISYELDARNTPLRLIALSYLSVSLLNYGHRISRFRSLPKRTIIRNLYNDLLSGMRDYIYA